MVGRFRDPPQQPRPSPPSPRHMPPRRPPPPRGPPRRRGADVVRATSLLDRQWRHERQGGKLLAQQRGEPRLIEQHLLVRRFPEGPDLLGFATGRKGPLLDGQRQQGF